MVYKKITIVAIVVAVLMAFMTTVTFATTQITTNDQLMDTTLNVLLFIQKYSWPVLTLVFVYALYQFYVAGSEIIDNKILGQRLIVGVAVFMVIIQCLPLAYAFILVQ